MEPKSAEIYRKFEPLFAPRSVALLGASKDPRKWGCIVLANLINGGFPGKIYPVNPREKEILGLRVYRIVGDIPETPDLAVIVVPPSSVLPVVKDCVSKGVRAGLVITAGFAEVGGEGERLQREMVEVARSGGMILVGPNCNGIMNPSTKLYPQMPPIFPPPGPIAVVAQSGNVATSIARRAMVKGFGCSKCISSGNEADLHCEDYLEYLAEDPETKVILSYVEGFKDGIRFLRTAKEVSKKKPIVMLKAGETQAGARAAMSHTASLAGSDAVFEAVCKQAGVIRARDLDELLNIGIALLRQPLPQGRRVGIVTAGGGWGVLAADACATLGLEVVFLPAETLTELDSFLPIWWNRGNPVDLVAGARGDAVTKCVEVLLRCAVVDSVILLGIMPALPTERLSPSTSEEEKERVEKTLLSVIASIFDELDGLAQRYQKPVIVASELPFADVSFENMMTYALGQRNYACYPLPHQAAMVLSSLARYSEYSRSVS
ncbi:MAG: CoA-binding protein [Dehalococcoidia bacterium]|nr:CoA-binding protein [Chloroflexota bacterium]MCK4242018.1 CoA-binding protein [Dehalococcoidia bacterium]